MKRVYLSAFLNFGFMGLGYIYNGKRVLSGIFLTIAGLGFYYLEQLYQFADGNSLPEHDSNAFIIMALCILVLNTGLAVDAYHEAKGINATKSA